MEAAGVELVGGIDKTEVVDSSIPEKLRKPRTHALLSQFVTGKHRAARGIHPDFPKGQPVPVPGYAPTGMCDVPNSSETELG